MKHVPEITLKSKPERAVIATRKYVVGALKLVMEFPKPTAVEDVKRKKEDGANALPHGAFIVKGADPKMFVASSVSTSCVIPAWWCKPTAVKSEANAAVEYVKFYGYEFPCVVNTKILKPGDEVIRFL